MGGLYGGRGCGAQSRGLQLLWVAALSTSGLFTSGCQGLGSPPPKKPLVRRGWGRGFGGASRGAGPGIEGASSEIPAAPSSLPLPFPPLVHSPGKTFLTALPANFSPSGLERGNHVCRRRGGGKAPAEMVAEGSARGLRPTRREGSLPPPWAALGFPARPLHPGPCRSGCCRLNAGPSQVPSRTPSGAEPGPEARAGSGGRPPVSAPSWPEAQMGTPVLPRQVLQTRPPEKRRRVRI